MTKRDEHRTLEAAQQSGTCLMHCWSVPAEGLDPLALYATLPTSTPDLDPKEVFLWHTNDRGWIVSLGQVDQRFLPAHASLSALEEARHTWATRCPEHLDPCDIILVGGVGFGETEPGAEWADFGQTNGWIPRWWVRADDRGVRAYTCYLVHPDHNTAHIDRVHQHQSEVLEAWLESAQLFDPDPVSCETGLAWREPGAQAWGAWVARATQMMGESAASIDKVVLARALEAEDVSTTSIQALGALMRTYPACTHYAVHPQGGRGPALLGATPERLIRKQGDRVLVDVLAGSCAPDAPESALLESAKDRWEHEVVLQEITTALEPVATLDVPKTPGLKRLHNVTHLHTPIRGHIDPSHSVLSLGARLHPTPAVCGRPREAARAWLLDAEADIQMSRGWYCGALGFVDLNGDGELDVIIRCALLHDKRARVFAGAGIVAGSDPTAELAETRIKSLALTRALGDSA